MIRFQYNFTPESGNPIGIRLSHTSSQKLMPNIYFSLAYLCPPIHCENLNLIWQKKIKKTNTNCFEHIWRLATILIYSLRSILCSNNMSAKRPNACATNLRLLIHKFTDKNVIKIVSMLWSFVRASSWPSSSHPSWFWTK